jgi:hypothetical protein
MCNRKTQHKNMSTISVFVQLTHDTCKKCGGLFAISQDYINEARRLGGFKQMWACPYCKTTWGYGESEVDQLNKKIAGLENSKRWLEERKQDAEREAEHFRKSRDGMKGALVKQSTRIKNGCCPCCKRHFGNLARHMASKHPKFSAPVESASPAKSAEKK